MKILTKKARSEIKGKVNKILQKAVSTNAVTQTGKGYQIKKLKELEKEFNAEINDLFESIKNSIKSEI